MLYFEILPDDILLIILKKSFKDGKSLSQITERLEYNHDKLVSLIKNGGVEPEVYIRRLEKINTNKIVWRSHDDDIYINNVDIFCINNDISFNIFDMLIKNENITHIYYDNHKYGKNGYSNIVYKIKSSKELLDLLSNFDIDISKLGSAELYVNVNQNWNREVFSTGAYPDMEEYYISRSSHIYINSDWNKFWNIQLNNEIRQEILKDNNII
jgi:hypothetical protein